VLHASLKLSVWVIALVTALKIVTVTALVTALVAVTVTALVTALVAVAVTVIVAVIVAVTVAVTTATATVAATVAATARTARVTVPVRAETVVHRVAVAKIVLKDTNVSGMARTREAVLGKSAVVVAKDAADTKPMNKHCSWDIIGITKTIIHLMFIKIYEYCTNTHY